MKALIFVRRGRATADGTIKLQIYEYLDQNKIMSLQLDDVIVGSGSSIEVKLYRCALMLRRANAISEERPVVVLGYPNKIHTGYQESNWSSEATQLLAWSSARYSPSMVDQLFPEDLNVIDLMDDLIYQSGQARKGLYPGKHPGVDTSFNNLAGGQEKGLVLVGDKNNHKPGMVFPQPFLAMRNSSAFLHSALASWSYQCGNGQLPWCFNAHDPLADAAFNWLYQDGPKGYIALGNEASKWLAKRGIKHATVRHPSYAKRFGNDLDGYIESLMTATHWATNHLEGKS